MTSNIPKEEIHKFIKLIQGLDKTQQAGILAMLGGLELLQTKKAVRKNRTTY